MTQSDLLSVCHELERSEEAVRSYTQAITNEREKYLMGETTLLSLLYIEDRRDVAFINRIAARQKAATALARLRFEIGRLVRFNGDEGSIEPGDLTSVALPEANR